MDDEHLHRSLQQCQDRLKTCLVCNMASQRQPRRKRQFFFAILHFQADLTVQTFSTAVVALVATLKGEGTTQ